jgi:hypothetical protein
MLDTRQPSQGLTYCFVSHTGPEHTDQTKADPNTPGQPTSTAPPLRSAQPPPPPPAGGCHHAPRQLRFRIPRRRRRHRQCSRRFELRFSLFNPLFNYSYLCIFFLRVRIRLRFLNLAVAGFLLNYQLARMFNFTKI